MKVASKQTALAAVTLWALAAPGSSQGSAFHYVQGGTPHGIHVESSAEAWVSLDGGVIRHTIDGGNSWSEMATPTDVRSQLRGLQMLDVGGPNLIGYCVGADGVVLATTDGGQTWTKKTTVYEGADPTTPASLHELHFFDANNGWVVGDDATIKVTTDGGNTWSNTAGIPSSILGVHTGKDVYDLHFLDPLTCVVVMDYGTIARTTDGGATWTEFNFDPQTQACVPPQIGSGSNLEFWAVDFIGQVGYAVGGVGVNDGYIFRTQDGGQTWTEENCFDFNCTTNCSATPPTLYGVEMFSQEEVIAVGYASSVFLREPMITVNSPCATCTSGSLGWKQYQPAQGPDGRPPLTWVVTLNNTEAWWTGQFGIIRKSTDQGQTYSELGTTSGRRLTDGSFSSATHGSFVGQAHTVQTTTDGGQTYTMAQFPVAGFGGGFMSAIEMDTNGVNGVAVAGGGSVYISTDGGASWGQASFPSSLQLNGCAFTTGNDRIYVVGNQGRVYASLDLGATWLDADPNNHIPNNVRLTDIEFASQLVAIAVGDDRAAYLTVDGGVNWLSLTLSGGFPLTDLNSVECDFSQTWAVSSFGEVFRLNYSTLVFEEQNLGTLANGLGLNDVSFVPGSTEVYACGDGGTVFHFDGSTWSAPKSQTIHNLVSVDFFSSTRGMMVSRKGGLISFH